MIRLTALFLTLTVALSSVAPVQPKPASDPPDAKAILAAALRAHRGERPNEPLKSVWFRGSVVIVSPQGDRQEFKIAQWYRRDTVTNGDAPKRVETIATRLEPNGVDEVSISGFDGRRHYVLQNGKRKVIDYDSNFKRDLDRIKGDLHRTRFIIETFFAGRLLRSDATVHYVGRASGGGLQSHVIDHTLGKERVRYYVNRTNGEPAFFLGIEFPASAARPKQNLCFSIGKMREFGGVRLPQEMRVHENDSPKPGYKLWIRNLEIDRKSPPGWAKGR